MPIPLLPVVIGGAVVYGAIKMLEELMDEPVYVAFDYEKDKHYKYLLEAWDANSEFDFRFRDASSDEVMTDDLARVKGALTTKIRDARKMLVIVGEEANRPHRHRLAIGYRNWINFEVAKAKEAGKPIVAVKIDRAYESPIELQGANAAWAMAFAQESIVRALRKA